MCVEEYCKDLRFHIVFTQHMYFQPLEVKFHLLKRKWKGGISKIKNFGVVMFVLLIGRKICGYLSELWVYNCCLSVCSHVLITWLNKHVYFLYNWEYLQGKLKSHSEISSFGGGEGSDPKLSRTYWDFFYLQEIQNTDFFKTSFRRSLLHKF